MSESCNNNCASCSANCSDRQAESLLQQPLEGTQVKKVIAVVSGKGGVGKSLVTSLLAVSMQRKGYQTAVMDADITGPSIPKAFGLKGPATGNELGIFPVMSKTGIEVMSINLLLEHETDPVIWRGPVIAGTAMQFWTEVVWNKVDFMFVDMPPGTGDVPLSVFQSMPVDGIIVVTSPQELVGMIVEKAVKMAGMLNIPVLGLVENLSYFECPDCGKQVSIFGESRVEELAKAHEIPNIAKIPMNQKLAAAVDAGTIELFEGPWLDGLTEALEKL